MKKLIFLGIIAFFSLNSNASRFEEVNVTPCVLTVVEGTVSSIIRIPIAKAPNYQTCRVMGQQKFKELTAEPRNFLNPRSVYVQFKVIDYYEEEK